MKVQQSSRLRMRAGLSHRGDIVQWAILSGPTNDTVIDEIATVWNPEPSDISPSDIEAAQSKTLGALKVPS
jgi:hypothetical protein